MNSLKCSNVTIGSTVIVTKYSISESDVVDDDDDLGALLFSSFFLAFSMIGSTLAKSLLLSLIGMHLIRAPNGKESDPNSMHFVHCSVLRPVVFTKLPPYSTIKY